MSHVQYALPGTYSGELGRRGRAHFASPRFLRLSGTLVSGRRSSKLSPIRGISWGQLGTALVGLSMDSSGVSLLSDGTKSVAITIAQSRVLCPNERGSATGTLGALYFRSLARRFSSTTLHRFHAAMRLLLRRTLFNRPAFHVELVKMVTYWSVICAHSITSEFYLPLSPSTLQRPI